MRKLLSVLILACAQISAQAQVCSAGSAGIGSTLLVGNSCMPVTAPAGNAVAQKALSAAMASQVLCTATQCPAGLYVVHGYIVITAAAALGAVQAQLTYSDDGGARTMSIGPNLSLSSTTAIGFDQVVELSGTTGITATTTITSLTGTPAYNVYLSAIKLRGF